MSPDESGKQEVQAVSPPEQESSAAAISNTNSPNAGNAANPAVVIGSTTIAPAADASHSSENTAGVNSPAPVTFGGVPVAGVTPSTSGSSPNSASDTSASSSAAAVAPPAAVGDAGYVTPSQTELTPAEVFARVKPAIVRVNVSTLGGVGHGSGFVLNTSGIVVTNYHVIAGGTKAWVEFFDDERIEIEGVLFMDHEKDISILKFDPSKTKRQLVAIPLAQELPPQGTSVVAIGAPLGLDMSITEGIVSAIRTADELKSTIGLQGHAGTWVQTTAAISPGNSGGPLLNRKCEVLAINTLTYSADHAQALNFAMSCTDIRQGLSEIEDVPIVLSPLVAPPRDIEGNVDESEQQDVLDISGTPDGQKRLAELKKIKIAFASTRSIDPYGVVSGSAKTELHSVLERLKIEESLITNDLSVLLVLLKMELAGDRVTVYMTSHILVVDESTGGQQMVKLWEKTGKVGTTTVQAMATGKLSPTLKKDIKSFFTKLREDVTEARRLQMAATGSGTSNTPSGSAGKTGK